jgi:hypothetical protein
MLSATGHPNKFSFLLVSAIICVVTLVFQRPSAPDTFTTEEGPSTPSVPVGSTNRSHISTASITTIPTVLSEPLVPSTTPPPACVAIDEEGLRHRRGIRQAGGFDDDAIETAVASLALLRKFAQNSDQIPAHGAADAAIVHLYDLFLALDQQFVVDAFLAELVFDDANALAVLLGEDTVQQRRLSGPEKAGKNRDRNGNGGEGVGTRHRGTLA